MGWLQVTPWVKPLKIKKMIDTSKYSKEELEEMFHEQQRQRALLHFTTSGRIDIDVNKNTFVLIQHIEDLLNKNVDLFKYVNKASVSQIAIIYQIFNIEQEEKMGYNNQIPPHCDDKKVLRTFPLMTAVEYKQFVCSGKEEALQILSQKTIDGIAELQPYSEKLNFDCKGLCTDLKELFLRTDFVD